ncbi:hypothetical protein [Candidatus Poriferisodalis sp.]|uniref:hypothetical protein n=1 Tax=Candidatus Poriferisodalis sp. TaxID=3101277 RepID=UPI003D1158EA
MAAGGVIAYIAGFAAPVLLSLALWALGRMSAPDLGVSSWWGSLGSALLMPLAAVWLAFRRSVRLGAALFAASMYASFVFGYLLHFVIDSPDLHSNVVGDGAGVFFHTALSLALIEFVGFAIGLVAAVRRIR